MFKKPLSNLKSFSLLTSSDRRRLRDEIYTTFPLLKDASESESAEPLLPNSTETARFATHVNEMGILYVIEKEPLWIKVEKMIIPSVYMLWKYPDMLPKIRTWGPVIDRLIGGADLMIPGVIIPPEGLPNLKEGELVGITVKNYKYPLAVGILAITTTGIKSQSNMRGKAVNVIHVYRDHLWAMGSKSDPPNVTEMSAHDGDEDLGDAIFDTAVDDETVHRDDEGTQKGKEDVVEEEDITEKTPDVKESLSIEEIDAILKTSFYFALKFKITPQHSPDLFPLSSSTLYSSYILPSRPAEHGSQIDVKRSSYKKVAKFMKVMEKAGIIKLKEQKGEIYMTGINWEHDELKFLEPYKTTTKSQLSSTSVQASSTSTSEPASSGNIEVIELYKPHGPTIRLFDEIQKSKDDLYTAHDVKTLLTEYVKNHSLANPRNQKQVKIDAILCDAVLEKEEFISTEYLPRDQLTTKFLKNMQEWHQVTPPGKEPIISKGHAKPIKVTVKVQRGHKTTTIVGVEEYDLPMDDLTERLKKLCASSVSVTPLQGTSPKNQVKEIMVQGPQAKIVGELLHSKGVPKKYIEINDKTNSKK